MDFTPARLAARLAALPVPPRYWVAYSGGLDSSVLLHALAVIRQDLPAPLIALHLDHGLQAGSGQWAAHCREICQGLGIPLRERALGLAPRPGESLEALAREARRAAFQAALGHGDLLLTAQHQDDQAETLLLQLLRGAGLAGLAAMPALVALPPGYLARPLLGFGRAQLHAYAEAAGLTWVEDPSNADRAFDRNYLRHELMPRLARRWPAHGETLARAARHCAEAQGLIDDLAREDLARCQGRRPGSLLVSALERLEPPRRRALLRHWIRVRGFATPNAPRLERILKDVAGAAPDRTPRVSWPGVEVRRYRDELFILPPLPPPPRESLSWEEPAIPLELPPGLGRLRWVGEGVPDGPLGVSFRAGGERCPLPGGAGHRSLKKLFQARGVPDWLRSHVPLIQGRDGRLAVAGLPGQPVAWVGHPWGDILLPPPGGRV